MGDVLFDRWTGVEKTEGMLLNLVVLEREGEERLDFTDRRCKVGEQPDCEK